MKKVLIILFLVILLLGCDNKIEEQIEMNCNDTVTKITIKENDKLSCKLLGEEYIFTIDKISDDKIVVSTDNYGLDSKSSLINKEKEWTVKKGELLTLHTQSTDYQEKVTFNW